MISTLGEYRANLLTLPVLKETDCRPNPEPSPELHSPPGNPDVHLFDSDVGPHAFVVNGSRIYGFRDREAAILARHADDAALVAELLTELGLDLPTAIDDRSPAHMPIRSLSLAVAQKCNLGCTYCYAQEGDFGGSPKAMSPSTARAAVDRMLADAQAGDRVNLAFLGGEPLLNRDTIRATTEYAHARARELGIRVGFSLTTNGTLVTRDDGDFFERFGFAVTVSLDGVGETHDRQRSFKSGRGTFDHIIDNVRPLLKMQRAMQVSARATVTPRNLELPRTLEALVALGFHSVGFSPMLASPTGQDTMSPFDLTTMLEQMISCGREFERRLCVDERFPFSNMTTALREIHRGTHRPYPCGAGGSYFGVSADGELAACHRFVGDQAGVMGHVNVGIAPERQARWLAERHVHRQEPCRSCWARYLCGGGCHHEVLRRGRPACDYIRGWLHYCLQAYVRLLDRKPEFFAN